MAVGKVKHGEDLLTSNGGVELKKIVDGFAAFEQVDEALNRHARTTETGRTAQAQGADPDRFIQPVLLFRGHNLKLSHIRQSRKSEPDRQCAFAFIPFPPIRTRVLSVARRLVNGARRLARSLQTIDDRGGPNKLAREGKGFEEDRDSNATVEKVSHGGLPNRFEA